MDNPSQNFKKDKFFRNHFSRKDWLYTPEGNPRGYIQPEGIKELWFHAGTVCNLSCPFCLEGSKPGDIRLDKVFFEDVRPFVDEALSLGVERFSFTGGEPFVVKDMVKILDYALSFRPCLVLTNGTKPLQERMSEILPLKNKPHPLNFRVSLDCPDAKRHDANRGQGNFELSLSTIKALCEYGFGVSIARLHSSGEDSAKVDEAFRQIFSQKGIPENILIVSFPDLFPPNSSSKTPHITEKCMTQYQTEETRRKFMCSFSKMVIKRKGRMLVSACTLVDDDECYDLAETLKESMGVRVMLKHHRCYACFSCGTSCSEL